PPLPLIASTTRCRPRSTSWCGVTGREWTPTGAPSTPPASGSRRGAGTSKPRSAASPRRLRRSWMAAPSRPQAEGNTTMFKRLMRVLKSWMGYFISFAEDPEVMLQESIEEMRNTLPRLNQILVTTRATAIRLEEERDALTRKEKSLVASIQTALKEGSAEARQLAEADAMTLQQVRQDLAATTAQLEAATQAFENAQLSVGDIKEKLRAKIEQARRAIAESKKAEVMKSAAA